MAAPKLRFKEFDGDWTSKQLGKIIGISSASRVFKEQWQDSGVPFFRTSDVVSIFKNKENEKAYISLELFEELAKKSGKIKQGDLLVTGGGTIGIPYLVPNDQPLYFKDADLLWMKSSGIVEGSFLYNFFISPKFREYLKSISHTGTISHFTIEQAKATPFGFPSKAEQTKIASFLSAVDEKISQLTQKHELLSQYKQGMMQKLFSQEIRFKADDGREFGEWEEKTLIDSVDTNIKWSFTGGPFGSNLKSEDYTELGIRIIQLQNIGDGAFLNDYKIYTSPEKANELLSCNIYPDEILISKMGDPVARCCIVPKHHDRYVMCSDGIRLVVDKQNYSSIFMFYQINYQDFRQSASDVSTGSTRKRIGLSDLKQLPIKVPCLEEQTKIANFLSAIDQKIEVVAQQIEQAKQWKKGLLQQMFV
ncbi:restriction endonuclease subunit S [Acinetobacter sp. WCHA29]|uniref:restriction endonuclease subunit S n=1 Tax=Acinetobacter sp. WCHA29 TaxID=2004649 RepID=UPI000B3D1851|nr:restriction endonuclease subunit S [Acinetobacter sp. WCHA29]